MSIEAPNLDDRTFQELVDEAKRYIAERCEGWTDHNVSDPGVTLIEAFAWMTETLLYRMNRVPERVYLKFLEMIGLSLEGPSAASVDVDFRLAAALDHDLTIPAGTQVSTERTATEEAVIFSLLEQVMVRTASSERVLRIPATGETEDVTASLGFGDGFAAFQPAPHVGDGVYLGFPTALDRHLLVVSVQVEEIAGHGIDPDDPPLLWQISGRDAWVDCEVVGTDPTSGFNESGAIELALPAGHARATIDGQDLYWLRCQVVPHDEQFRSSPQIVNISANSIGVIASCVNAIAVSSAHLGESTGVSGQEFQLDQQPIVARPDQELSILAYPRSRTESNGTVSEDPPSAWAQVSTFADSGPDDRHFTLDATSGIVRFGPEIREASGEFRRYGAVPERNAAIVVTEHLTGGGAEGNVVPGAIRTLRTSVPHVAKVRNRHRGTGGLDAERLDQARRRGPLELRARNRAVTAEDYEYLAQMSSSAVSRVRCLADDGSLGAAAVRLFVVPEVPDRTGPLTMDELDPSPEVLQRVAERIDEVRLVGSLVAVEPPEYVAVAVEASVQARANASIDRVREQVTAALYRYFHPVRGGEDGEGWAFGRSIRVNQAIAVVQGCPGVESVDEVTLWAVAPGTDSPENWPREAVSEGIELNPHELVTSGVHQIDVYHLED